MDIFGSGQDRDLRPELYDLLEDSFDIVPRGEGVDAVEIAIAPDYVQGVGADGAGRSEQGEAFHFKQMRGCFIIAWRWLGAAGFGSTTMCLFLRGLRRERGKPTGAPRCVFGAIGSFFDELSQ